MRLTGRRLRRESPRVSATAPRQWCDRGTWQRDVRAAALSPSALAGVRRVLRPEGTAIPEGASPGRSKRSAPAVARPSSQVTRFSASGTARSPSTRRRDRTSSLPSRPTSPSRRRRPCRSPGSTALQAVRDHGKVQPGRERADHRRSGWRRQLRRADRQGLRCGGHRCAQHGEGRLVRALGADRVIDYTTEDFADGSRRYDVILDIGGQPSAVRSAACPDAHGSARHRRRRDRTGGGSAA